jgi:hypothetical protein
MGLTIAQTLPREAHRDKDPHRPLFFEMGQTTPDSQTTPRCTRKRPACDDMSDGQTTALPEFYQRTGQTMPAYNLVCWMAEQKAAKKAAEAERNAKEAAVDGDY